MGQLCRTCRFIGPAWVCLTFGRRWGEGLGPLCRTCRFLGPAYSFSIFSILIIVTFKLLVSFLFIILYVLFCVYLLSCRPIQATTQTKNPHMFYLCACSIYPILSVSLWDGAYPRPPCPSVIAVRLARPVSPVRRPPPSVSCLRFAIPIVLLRRKQGASFIQTKKRNKAKAS